MTNGTVFVCCLGLGLRASFREMSEAREAFLIHIGKTLEPAGLNRRDEM